MGYSLEQSQWKTFWQHWAGQMHLEFLITSISCFPHSSFTPWCWTQCPGCPVHVWGVLWAVHLLSEGGAHLSLQEALPVLLQSQQAPRPSYFNEQDSGASPVQAVSSRAPQRLSLCIWIALALNASSRFTPACEASQEHFESTWPVILATLCPLCISLVHRMNPFTSAVWTHTSLFQNCLLYFSTTFKNIP